MKKFIILLFPIIFVSCATTRMYTEINFEKADENIAYEETTTSATVLNSKPDVGIITFDIFCVPFIATYSATKGLLKTFLLPIPYGMAKGWTDGLFLFSDFESNYLLDELKEGLEETKYQKKLEIYNSTTYYKFRKVLPAFSICEINGTLFEKDFYFDGATKISKSNIVNLQLKDTISDTVGRIDAGINLFFNRAFRFIIVGISAPFYAVGWIITAPIAFIVHIYKYNTDPVYKQKYIEHKKIKKQLKEKERLIIRRKKYYKR